MVKLKCMLRGKPATGTGEIVGKLKNNVVMLVITLSCR